jgi:hypothetical protein
VRDIQIQRLILEVYPRDPARRGIDKGDGTLITLEWQTALWAYTDPRLPTISRMIDTYMLLDRRGALGTESPSFTGIDERDPSQREDRD